MRVGRLVAASLLLAAFVVATCQAASGRQITAYPFTMNLTYRQTNQGKDVGETSRGIEGKGTMTMHIAGTPGAVSPQVLAKGGSYVVRSDIVAAGTYHGVLAVTAGTRKFGTLCLLGDVGFGKYDPSAGTGFPPTSGPFHSVGGTGLAGRVSLSGKYIATKVTGSEDRLLKIAFKGVVTVAATAPKAPSKACLAVAKLGRS